MQILGCCQLELMGLSDWSKVRESAFSLALALHWIGGDLCGSAAFPRARRASSLGCCAFSTSLSPPGPGRAAAASFPELPAGIREETGPLPPGPTPNVGGSGSGTAETAWMAGRSRWAQGLPGRLAKSHCLSSAPTWRPTRPGIHILRTALPFSKTASPKATG